MSGISIIISADDPPAPAVQDDAAICRACTIEPDCIYCMDEPPIELRRQCPIWVRESARQKPAASEALGEAAYIPQGEAKALRRKRAGKREARVHPELVEG